jgi:hypothetical protein
MITDEDYKFLQDKYGSLIYKISHKIYGDRSLSLEDITQELWIAVLEAITAYSNQNSGINGTFEDFKDSPGFNQYVKTVLWNRFNRTAGGIAKKSKLYSAPVDVVEFANVFADKSGSLDYFSECLEKIENQERKIILQGIIDNYYYIVDGAGNINKKELCRRLGISLHELNSTLSKVANGPDLKHLEVMIEGGSYPTKPSKAYGSKNVSEYPTDFNDFVEKIRND